MSLSRPVENPRQAVLLAALVAAAGSIPLQVNLNSFALIFLVFACVIQQPLSRLAAKLASNSLWMIPALYFLWLCCTYFWDSTGGFSVKDIERYAMLLFIPVSLAVVPPIPQQFLRIMATIFIAVTIGVCVGCLLKSYSDYQVYHNARTFFYHYLSQQMDLNAIFLSNYCLSGMVWLLYDCFLLEKKRTAFRYVSVMAVCLFLFGMILLLSSKLVTFLTIVMLVLLILYIGYRRQYLKKALVVVVLLASVGLVAVNNLGYLHWRISETSVKKYEGPQDNNNGLSIRMMMWQVAWDMIKKRPLLGYGVKGSRAQVVEQYRVRNFEIGYREGYHSHDQYLQSALAGGIPALLLLITMIAGLAWKGMKNRNVLLLLLLFHFVCQSVIESTFEVQQELAFYILFLFVLYYHFNDAPARVETNIDKTPSDGYHAMP